MLAPGYFVVAASIALAGIFLAALLWGLRKTKGDRRPIGIGIVAFVLFAVFCETSSPVLMFPFPKLNEEIGGKCFCMCSTAAPWLGFLKRRPVLRVQQGHTAYNEPGMPWIRSRPRRYRTAAERNLGLCLTVPEPFGGLEAIFGYLSEVWRLRPRIALSLIVFIGVRLGRKKYAEAVGLSMLANVPIGLYKYGPSPAVCEAALPSVPASWRPRRLAEG